MVQRNIIDQSWATKSYLNILQQFSNLRAQITENLSITNKKMYNIILNMFPCG